ncbi:FAD-binding oxidoreductase [Microbacterium sp. 179-B 1A2 NHS]|uniref:FAD-binding oxidoreductase n=1 Tax=Microbacterium sp. 179-B 1A2 NHS TaxID=3142383 RepID=UPI0039A20D55
MTLEELASAAPGVVVTPADEEWDAARRFHSGIGTPAVVVRARTVDDVRAAVRHAAALSLPVLVRSGGHGPWGALDGGLTIDLAGLAGIVVDGTTVRVGGGARWGDVARTLAGHGLGLSSGDTASVGVGGLTLGGGIGWMVRAWGLAADQLVGVQLVTAAGDVVEATDATDPGLLWALRGGGGNFGVVTRFDFRASPLPAVVFATLTVTGDPAEALRVLRDTMDRAPRELTATYMDVPAMDPSAPAGATITACWIGDDVTAARAALGPVLASGAVGDVEIGIRSYPEILLEMPAADPDQPMPGFVGGNTMLRELTDEAIAALVAFRAGNPASVLFLRSLGGAFGEVPADATAFAARDATWFAMAGAFDIPGLLDDAGRGAAVRDWAVIEGLGAGVYGNFTTSMEPSWVPRMFPPATLARLTALKGEWDPGNVFARNHNLAPR